MKRPANIKDSIMMPPPKARTKSRSDTSEELRRNLIETITNASENSALQEEFHKFFKEMEELEPKKNDDESSVSTSSLVFEKVNSSSLNNCTLLQTNNNTQSSQYQNFPHPKNSFNFNLVHYNYNYTNSSDDEENTESVISLEKLRKNLTENRVYNYNLNSNYLTNNKNHMFHE